MIEAMGRSSAIIAFDLRGQILAANANFLRSFGYAEEEVIGQHHSMFCPPGLAQSVQYRNFWADLAEGKFQSGRYKRIGKHNAQIWIQATYHPLFDVQGKPYKVVKFALDITSAVEREITISNKIDEITAVLQELTRSIESIANNTADTTKQADLAIGKTESGHDVSDAFEQIHLAIKATTESISGIYGSTNEQASATRKANSLLAELSGIAA
eukprot:gene32096-36890_t